MEVGNIADIDAYEAEIADYKTQVNKLNDKVEEASPWFEMKAEEKEGYNIGITYSQLARTPDDYL